LKDRNIIQRFREEEEEEVEDVEIGNCGGLTFTDLVGRHACPKKVKGGI
jgi:hypothetical protein